MLSYYNGMYEDMIFLKQYTQFTYTTEVSLFSTLSPVTSTHLSHMRTRIKIPLLYWTPAYAAIHEQPFPFPHCCVMFTVVNCVIVFGDCCVMMVVQRNKRAVRICNVVLSSLLIFMTQEKLLTELSHKTVHSSVSAYCNVAYIHYSETYSSTAQEISIVNV